MYEITSRGFKLISNYSECMRSDNVPQMCERFSYLLKLFELISYFIVVLTFNSRYNTPITIGNF